MIEIEREKGKKLCNSTRITSKFYFHNEPFCHLITRTKQYEDTRTPLPLFTLGGYKNWKLLVDIFFVRKTEKCSDILICNLINRKTSRGNFDEICRAYFWRWEKKSSTKRRTVVLWQISILIKITAQIELIKKNLAKHEYIAFVTNREESWKAALFSDSKKKSSNLLFLLPFILSQSIRFLKGILSVFSFFYRI